MLVYVFFHVNSAESSNYMFQFDKLDNVFLIYTVVLVLVTWELLDFTLAKLGARSIDVSQYRNVFKLVLILTVVTVPAVVFGTWFSEYVLKPKFDNNCVIGDFESFVKMAFQAQVLGWLIIAERLLQINHHQAKRMDTDKALMQKELLQSQYVNLKNQVNPHFLFNSFSVLQSLIDTKPEEASKFLSQLSKMYRYILDHREDSMSSLEKELEVLESYLYLLKIRHEESIGVSVKIDPTYYHFYIPTLSLQMLVENAVKHNRFSRDEPLSVKLFVENGYLIVKNKVKKRGSYEDSTKLGLENIKSQYELQTEKTVIITEDEHFFTVKLPILTGLRLA